MAGNKVAYVYEEFEPFCKWQRKEDRDILEIHLQDFKKDQLKVQISNHGILKISGERQLDALTKTKFQKETPVPINKYHTQSIHAKFVNGCLYITMPKISEINGSKSSAEPSKYNADQTPKPEIAKSDQSNGSQVTSTGGGDPTAGFEFHARRRSSGLNVAVSLAATAAVMAVMVAYVVYMYRSTVDN